MTKKDFAFATILFKWYVWLFYVVTRLPAKQGRTVRVCLGNGGMGAGARCAPLHLIPTVHVPTVHAISAVHVVSAVYRIPQFLRSM